MSEQASKDTSANGHKSLMRCLGEFVGHIAHAVKTDVTPDLRERLVVRRDVQEAVAHTPDGQIILRRTTIDEVERPSPPPT